MLPINMSLSSPHIWRIMYSQEKKMVVQHYSFSTPDADAPHHSNHTYAVQCHKSYVISLEELDDSQQLHNIYNNSTINKTMNENEYQMVTLHWPLTSLKVL